MKKKIQSALISVFSKNGIAPIVKKLAELNISIISTGGTHQYITDMGVKAVEVEGFTSYPSILGGRVKTLHPKIFGGILHQRAIETDVLEVGKYEIPPIDLVIVDLYPFEDTVVKTKDESEIIEKIDIGGVSLIRAAAKNFKDVLVISSKDDYSFLNEILINKGAYTEESDRKAMATKAFAVSSHYDTAIFNYFNTDQKVFRKSINESKVLRYGENPHQKGIFYGEIGEILNQLHGKELSYNNLLDIEAALYLIYDFKEVTIAILKHNNACGIASRKNLTDAWTDALAGDPISAFGGIIVCNQVIEEDVAKKMNEIFFEVILAPEYTKEALAVLQKKKNRIIIKYQHLDQLPKKQSRTLLNGVLEQDRDTNIETINEIESKTDRKPGQQETDDLIFANKVVKHTKSNAIVLVKNKQLLASGMGQTSRVDALKQAIAKAKANNFKLNGAVMASDAFFPFPDCVEIAQEEGIIAVLQPGGSIKDQLSIDSCDKNNMTMVFTGVRHFKH